MFISGIIFESRIPLSLSLFVAGRINASSTYQTILVFLLLSTHCIFMVTVNVVYVIELLSGLSPADLALLQLALSVVKLLWNSVFIGWATKKANLSNGSRLLCSTFMQLFTFLVGPVLATIFTDPLCFSYVITGLPSVSSSFQTNQYECTYTCDADLFCHDVCGISQSESLTIHTTVTPSWLYSYQCSSAILTNYIPVLINVQVLSGFVIPALQMMYMSMSPSIILAWIPSFVRHDFLHGLNTCEVAEKSKAGSSKHSQVVDSTRIISKIFLNLAILMTFGLACPLLAVGVAISAWSSVLVLKVGILRYVGLHDGGGDRTGLVGACSRLEEDTADISSGAASALTMSFIVAALFWCMFVFDMMGDVYGALVGGLTMLMPVLGSLLAHSLATYYTSFRARPPPICSKLSDLHSPLIVSSRDQEINSVF